MKNSISKLIDSQLFKWVDRLKSTPQYAQFSSQLEGIPEDYGKFVNQGITYFISFFPFVILLAMGIYFGLAQSVITEKRELLEQLIETNTLAKEAEMYSGNLVGKLKISGLSEVKSEIARIASQQGIESSGVSVETFDAKTVGGLTKSQATIKINALKTPELISLLRVLAVNEKFKISNIELKRRSDSISGSLSLIYFAKEVEEAPVEEGDAPKGGK